MTGPITPRQMNPATEGVPSTGHSSGGGEGCWGGSTPPCENRKDLGTGGMATECERVLYAAFAQTSVTFSARLS